MNKNFLIFGGGSKFGLHLTNRLETAGCRVYVVSSSLPESQHRFHMDWLTCDFMSVEKILKQISQVDVVIFNQNYHHVPEIINLSMAKPLQWQQGRHWTQAHFVNNVLPCQVLNSLCVDGKFTDRSLAVWMLSGVVIEDHKNMLGYRAQKMLNAQIIKSVRENSAGNFIGFDPGTITTVNQIQKAQALVDFLLFKSPSESCYQFTTDLTGVVPHSMLV